MAHGLGIVDGDHQLHAEGAEDGGDLCQLGQPVLDQAMRRVAHVDIVDAQHIQAHRGHHAGQQAQLLGLIIQHAVVKKHGAPGIAALNVTVGIVPIVEHAQGIFGLLGMVGGQLFAAVERHQHPVCAVEHADIAAGDGHGITFAADGEGLAGGAVGQQLDLHIGSDHGQRLGQLKAGDLYGGGQIRGNILCQKRQPITKFITHGREPPVCFLPL